MKKKNKAAGKISKKKKVIEELEYETGVISLKGLSADDVKALKRKLKEMKQKQRDSIFIFFTIAGTDREIYQEGELWKKILSFELEKAEMRNKKFLDEPYATLGQRTIEFDLVKDKFFASYRSRLNDVKKIKGEINRRLKHLDKKKPAITNLNKILELLEAYFSALSEADSHKEAHNKLREDFEKLQKDYSKLKPN
jgi:ribosomal protein S8